MKRFLTFLCTCIAFIFVFAPSMQAATAIKSCDKPLTIAAIALNLPYTVYALCSKNESLCDRLFYQGAGRAALWNHSLNLINFAALSSELPAKYLFLAGGIFLGLQTSTYLFCQSYGVSLVWSGLTGMLCHRLGIQKNVKSHLLLAMLLNSITLVYYAYKAPAITTIAHLGGVAAGFSLSFLLPYKKASP
ncbi:hypothetical protein [Cardinium endosymbiont of Nabis limbatus]|uniref:hypothetical protein n=1 Tax=Cardinium endosymbiont of Nabis limbatus TaxID=3066217 RepID=UPI003AF3AB4F